ncbi:MAG TPA: bifunctional metallophosphatase/5'-nucleotidase [Myxococcales bacterium]|nr:bifunctional metallophosphatase/5'-nucleotidase [Myxococcales bacterium]
MNRVIVLLVALLCANCALAEPHRFVIFHTSDIHGGIAKRPAHWHKKTPKRLIGGFAALAALVKKEALPYLLLDSGDIFQGTPEGNLTKGRAVIEAMNALGYDAMAVGNHEFDYGENNLKELSKLANFPMLAANIRIAANKAPISYAKSRRMLRVGKIKVGVIGIATQHTRSSTLPKNVVHLIFKNEVKSARKHAIALRKKGADVVIVLAHCGLAPSVARKRLDPNDLVLTENDKNYVGDLAIARGAPVDIVFGGHMHTGLTAPWRDPESGVHIVQSYENLASVSRLEITVDRKSKPKVQVSGRLVDLWVDQHGEDAAVLELVQKHQNQVGKRLDEKIGTLNESMIRAGYPLDNPLGSWMTDIMRMSVAADIGIQNTYGIRDDLRAGTISLRDIYRVMPFENTVVVVTLSGKQVKQLVRDNMRGQKSGIQISGIRVHLRFDPQKQTLQESWVLHKGAPIDDEKLYRVATNNYLAQGGTGGKVMKGAPTHDTGRSIRKVIVEAVRQHSPITPPKVGRYQMLPALSVEKPENK